MGKKEEELLEKILAELEFLTLTMATHFPVHVPSPGQSFVPTITVNGIPAQNTSSGNSGFFIVPNTDEDDGGPTGVREPSGGSGGSGGSGYHLTAEALNEVVQEQFRALMAAHDTNLMARFKAK